MNSFLPLLSQQLLWVETAGFPIMVSTRNLGFCISEGRGSIPPLPAQEGDSIYSAIAEAPGSLVRLHWAYVISQFTLFIF